jgi:hypothetical protein
MNSFRVEEGMSHPAAIVSPLSCNEEATRLSWVSNTYSLANLLNTSRAKEGSFFSAALVSPLSNKEGVSPLLNESNTCLQNFAQHPQHNCQT